MEPFLALFDQVWAKITFSGQKHCQFLNIPFPFSFVLLFIVNWDSLHVRLNSHYEARSYKKKKHKKVKAYRKSVWKEPTVKRFPLILELMLLKSKIKGKHSIDREFQCLAVRGKKLLNWISL